LRATLAASLLLLQSIAVLSSGCSTNAPSPTFKEDWRGRYSKDWKELTPPPAKADGDVVPLPDKAVTNQEEELMATFDLPYGGVCMSYDKAYNAAQLRIYADKTYADGMLNTQIGQIRERVLLDEIQRREDFEQKRREHEETFWHKNQNTISTGVGFVLGVVLTVVIVSQVKGVLE
jgi:hypothetical protein